MGATMRITRPLLSLSFLFLSICSNTDSQNVTSVVKNAVPVSSVPPAETIGRSVSGTVPKVTMKTATVGGVSGVQPTVGVDKTTAAVSAVVTLPAVTATSKLPDKPNSAGPQEPTVTNNPLPPPTITADPLPTKRPDTTAAATAAASTTSPPKATGPVTTAGAAVNPKITKVSTVGLTSGKQSGTYTTIASRMSPRSIAGTETRTVLTGPKGTTSRATEPAGSTGTSGTPSTLTNAGPSPPPLVTKTGIMPLQTAIATTTTIITTRPTNTRPTNTRPTNTGPTNTRPTNIGPTNIGPTNTRPTNIGPTNTGPTNTGPTNTRPTNTRPTNTGPTNTRPTNIRPTNTGPTNIGPTNTRPTSTRPTSSRPTSTRPTSTRPTSSGAAAQLKTFLYSLNNGHEKEEEKDLVKLCKQLMVNLQDGNCTVEWKHHNVQKHLVSVEINGNVKTSLANQYYEDITKIPTDNKTLIAILASCGALLIMIVILAVCASHHRKPYSDNQQHLTEELHTVENGYHDNPTLEVMEVQPEMQEKKMALNGEFNDSWIVPIENLLKDDAADEEDTHL